MRIRVWCFLSKLVYYWWSGKQKITLLSLSSFYVYIYRRLVLYKRRLNKACHRRCRRARCITDNLERVNPPPPTPLLLLCTRYAYRACTRGHYCPAGSADPVDCVAGTYQNDTGASDCDICPARHYCEATTTNATLCPAGYFCPEGTEFATEFPCHNGTYSNETGLAAATECTLCPPGRCVLCIYIYIWHTYINIHTVYRLLSCLYAINTQLLTNRFVPGRLYGAILFSEYSYTWSMNSCHRKMTRAIHCKGGEGTIWCIFFYEAAMYSSSGWWASTPIKEEEEEEPKSTIYIFFLKRLRHNFDPLPCLTLVLKQNTTWILTKKTSCFFLLPSFFVLFIALPLPPAPFPTKTTQHPQKKVLRQRRLARIWGVVRSRLLLCAWGHVSRPGGRNRRFRGRFMRGWLRLRRGKTIKTHRMI